MCESNTHPLHFSLHLSRVAQTICALCRFTLSQHTINGNQNKYAYFGLSPSKHTFTKMWLHFVFAFSIHLLFFSLCVSTKPKLKWFSFQNEWFEKSTRVKYRKKVNIAWRGKKEMRKIIEFDDMWRNGIIERLEESKSGGVLNVGMEIWMKLW